MVATPSKVSHLNEHICKFILANSSTKSVFSPIHDDFATCLYVIHIGVRERILLGGRKKFALKITICPKNRQLVLKDFWATLCLPWKTELPWNFSLYWIYFLHSGVLSNLHALALKNRVALNSQYWLYIFYHSGCLSNLRLPWQTELPWYFHCIKHVFFIIQEFWVTRACPEKTELPRNVSLYWIYFLLFWSFE